MKHYYCTVMERSGDFEYDSNFVMASDKIEEDFNHVCVGFRGDGWGDTDDDGLVWTDAGAIDTNDSYYKEIPESDFTVLAKYLANLTVTE